MPKIPVTVYHIGESCVQCNQTKRLMDQYGIHYEQIDLRDHPELVDKFREQGHLTAPIVTTDIKIWSGFRHSKITSLASYIRSMEKDEPNE